MKTVAQFLACLSMAVAVLGQVPAQDNQCHEKVEGCVKSLYEDEGEFENGCKLIPATLICLANLKATCPNEAAAEIGYTVEYQTSCLMERCEDRLTTCMEVFYNDYTKTCGLTKAATDCLNKVDTDPTCNMQDLKDLIKELKEELNEEIKGCSEPCGERKLDNCIDPLWNPQDQNSICKDSKASDTAKLCLAAIKPTCTTNEQKERFVDVMTMVDTLCSSSHHIDHL